MTTNTNLTDLIRQINKNHIQIKSIYKTNQNLHYIQTKPSFMIKLRHTDLIINVKLDLKIG